MMVDSVIKLVVRHFELRTLLIQIQNMNLKIATFHSRNITVHSRIL